MHNAIVIGAGLAGSEAAWQLAQRGIHVDLYEMKPVKMTPGAPQQRVCGALLLQFAARCGNLHGAGTAQRGAAPRRQLDYLLCRCDARRSGRRTCG